MSPPVKNEKPRSLMQGLVDATNTSVTVSVGVDAGIPRVVGASASVNSHWTPGAGEGDVYGVVGAGLPLGGASYFVGKDKFEARVTALPLGMIPNGPKWLPNISYSKGDPVLGDRLAAYIPLVGSAQITSNGAIGGYAALPAGAVRPGAGVWISNPAFAHVTKPVFEVIDAGIAVTKKAMEGRRPVHQMTEEQLAKHRAMIRQMQG